MNTKSFNIINHDVHDESCNGAVVKPIFQNSLFTFKDYESYLKSASDEFNNSVYTRGKNPTLFELEEKIARLENGEVAKFFASGMGAISASIMTFVESGSHIIYFDQIYGPAQRFISEYLFKFNVESTAVNGNSLEEIERAIKPNTKIIYMESPSSFFFEVYDIEKIANLAKKRGITTIIDNTWATPINQNPLDYGIDVVVHSASKYIGGHSDIVAGVAICNKKIMNNLFKDEFMLLGAIGAPLTGSLGLRGLRTLPIRLKAHEENTRAFVKALKEIKWITKINYPGDSDNEYYEISKKYLSGYSGLISIEGVFTREQAIEIVNNLEYFRIGCSWGGFDSLALPLFEKRRKNEEPTVIIRMNIGLEEVDSLIEDVKNAFSKVFK